MMDTIFTVKDEDFARLSPQEAVEFFRELLWAEARRIGIPVSKIHVSSWINVPDGGIDALVEENEVLAQSDLIKVGYTGFQIKAGTSFEPWQDGQVRKELFGSKHPSKENLGSSVRDCLDRDGTYVLVCFKQDLAEEKRRQAVDTFKNYFQQCGYKNPKVEVWSQNNLIGFLKVFPSLSLRITRRDALRFQTHKSWVREAEMKRDFKAGQAQRDFISSIQDELRKNTEAVHIRVFGEPGIGKTRLVLEATRAEDLQPLVIYCDSAHKFRDSDLMNELLKDDNQFSAILVVDECDPDSRSYIWNKLQQCGPRVKLISIYGDFDDTTGTIYYLNAPLLDEEQISNIIQGYGIPQDQVRRWSEFCSGSPRVAHVLGINLKNNPEDLLKSPDTVNIWDRYITGGDDLEGVQVRQRRLVLRHIALFKRFGYGRPVIGEAQTISKMVEKADPQVTWPRFQEIIKNLKIRKILQGENTLYITPKALHIKLWIEWWDTYGGGFGFEEFYKNLPDSLREWFYEMFKYAGGSEIAARITKELLGENGPFQKVNYLRTREGGRFFLALTEADPAVALDCLKKTVGTWNRDERLSFTTGRRHVVWALERITIWRDLFADAARLLLMLGEAENETASNNASGVFAQLFSPAYGKVAPTEAPPEERFPILKEALEADTKERRMLALRASDQALESRHFSRTVGAEHQGLKKEPELWKPKTYGELFDAYRRVWQFLREKVNSLPHDEQQQVVDIFLKRARGLGRIHNLADMVIDTVNELAQKPYVDKMKVLAAVSRLLRFDGKEMPVPMRQRWEHIKDAVTGHDLSSLMKRYVGTNLEDRIDFEEGKHKDRTQSIIEELAKQASENQYLLKQELGWLVTTEAQNGYRFGYALGKTDKDFSLLPLLLKAQREAGDNGSAFFLGGYVRVLFEANQQEWENQMDALCEDAKLKVWIPELTLRSGMSDKAALRILNLAERGVIGANHFGLFRYGDVVNKISENVFKKWIEFLLSNTTTYAVSIAIDLYHSYYLRKDSEHILPEELTLKLLTHQVLFQKPAAGSRDQMDDYYWTEIAKGFIRLYPEMSWELTDTMLEHFGEDGSIFDNYDSQAQTVLNEIAQRHPEEVWSRITKYLGPPFDERSYQITVWLRGNFSFFGENEEEGALVIFPVEKIWKWVDENVEERAWYLASFVPKKLFREGGKVCLAREVLVRYGDREDVRNSLRANFATEGWSGPESAHHQNTKQQLLDFRKDEDNENVKRWIDEYVAEVDHRIEQAKIEEERRGF